MLKRLVVALLLAAVACGGGAPGALRSCKTPRPAIRSTPETKTVHAAGWFEETVHARVDMTVRGDSNYTFSCMPILLHIVQIWGDKVPTITRFFSVSAGEPKVIDDENSRILFDADLAPGAFDGPGTYTISAQQRSQPLPGKSSLSGAAYFQVLVPLPKPYGPRYDILVKPCTVTVAAEGAFGEVDCPALELEGTGRRIAWHWRWEIV